MTWFNLSLEQAQKEALLLSICKQHQGEYRPSHHGSGSFATTYSNEFVRAAAGLYRLYSAVEFDSVPPDMSDVLHSWVLYFMAQRFRESGISSCRGAVMTTKIVGDIYVNHLHTIIKREKRLPPK